VIGEIFKYQEYRAAEEVIKSAQNVIIDVGAHAGFFSLYAAALNPEVRIVAVEPFPENLKLIRKHLGKNDIKTVETVAGGIAGETGERFLVLERDSHNHRLNLPKEDLLRRSTIKIDCWSLSDFLEKEKIKKVDLLKMDIEGLEYEIFSKLDAETLSKIKNIILEYHNYYGKEYKELEAKLRENGFGVRVFPSQFDHHMGFLFAVNKKK
jgi:FkbM family methyltransferase